MEDFNVGDLVKHRFRDNKYQHCIILEIEDGCNGLIKVLAKDGMYGSDEISYFCPQDLTKI